MSPDSLGKTRFLFYASCIIPTLDQTPIPAIIPVACCSAKHFLSAFNVPMRLFEFVRAPSLVSRSWRSPGLPIRSASVIHCLKKNLMSYALIVPNSLCPFSHLSQSHWQLVNLVQRGNLIAKIEQLTVAWKTVLLLLTVSLPIDR